MSEPGLGDSGVVEMIETKNSFNITNVYIYIASKTTKKKKKTLFEAESEKP